MIAYAERLENRPRVRVRRRLRRVFEAFAAGRSNSPASISTSRYPVVRSRLRERPIPLLAMIVFEDQYIDEFRQGIPSSLSLTAPIDLATTSIPPAVLKAEGVGVADSTI
ncbi:MAG: hypothetical protein MZU97_21985 [Bacillus subtilis]|nr:hypothetical protein [Bacillus subtilis]